MPVLEGYWQAIIRIHTMVPRSKKGRSHVYMFYWNVNNKDHAKEQVEMHVNR